MNIDTYLSRPRLARAALVALTGLLLVACSSKETATPASQVAAKVGKQEISVSQINQMLSRSNNAASTPEAMRKLSREVLEKLIDQQLAVDQAIEAKLHRTPEVVAQLESTRREILARAYLQQITSGLPKPSAEQVAAYYAANPALFGERRVFVVQELVVGPKAGVTTELRTMAQAGRTVEEVAAWLKTRGVPFGGGRSSRAAEQIPLPLLPTLHALRDGQSTVLETAQATTLLRLVSSTTAPVPLATAQPMIERFLSNQAASAAVTAQIKALREATPTVYMGEFAGSPPPAATPPLAAQTPASAPSAAATLARGVAGLK